MIQLIHGTDTYLSYKFLKIKKEEYEKKGYEIKTINVDDDFEVSDPTVLYGALSEQDLFGSQKLLILKRITSSDHFFKLGRPLKVATKLFESIKSTPNEIIIWEDKILTAANPLSKLTKDVRTFTSPVKEYEISGYIQSNFKDIPSDIKKIILGNIKSTDTNEIATEIEKITNMPPEHIKPSNMVLSQNTPTWIISDNISIFVANPTNANLQKLFSTLESIDEDIRYKLVIIQNQLAELLYARHIKETKDNILKEKIFGGRRGFVYQKIERILGNIDMSKVLDLYQKSLIVEYLLNNGLISEKVALENIFVSDIRSMNSELLFE